MRLTQLVAILFIIAAVYDGGLGAAFLLAPAEVYRMADVTPPNHWAYVQFPAALLLIFAMMFVAIARHPIRDRGLMIYGILLKVAYCATAFWHWFAAGIPGLWKPFAVIDLIFAVLFFWAYRATSAEPAVPA